jgi:hypothetical protein
MIDFSSFATEFVKLSFKLTPESKAEVHFLSEKPDWKAFERNLKSGVFRKAVLDAKESDPTLKRYVKNFGGYQASKDVIAEIKSKDSGKTYKIKDLHTGRWGCNCGNWQYSHSVKGGDCKHIKSVRRSKLVKAAGAGMVLGAGFSFGNRSLTLSEKGKKSKRALGQIRQNPVPW